MQKTLIMFVTISLTLLCSVSAFSNQNVRSTGKNRTALVIGNSDYRFSPLKNPTNDAQDMARVLRSIGFDVILKTNADKPSIVKALNLFGQKLTRSEIGIFFFAGHGVQVNNRNFLIPLNSQIQSESDVEFEGIHAGRVLGKMENAGNRLNIVILDACRNNPFKKNFRSSVQGLAKMDAPPGSIIAYATSPGSTASDGAGRNGAYTGELLKQLGNPDLTIQEVFNEAGLEVMKVTKKRQIPWISSTPVPKYYLAKNAKPYISSTGSSTKSGPNNTWFDPVTNMAFIWIPGGCFIMAQSDFEKQYLKKKYGSQKHKEFFYNELPGHKVCVDGFWMGRFEVTNRQYRMFNPKHTVKSYDGNDLDNDMKPVVHVSHKDARAFIQWLNRSGKYTFSLPTEAQWEYAARAGTTTSRFWGNAPDQACRYANGADAAAKSRWTQLIVHPCNDAYPATAPVGSFTPNAFGLYDMLGNVWEWCKDVYSEKAYTNTARTNPLVTSGSSNYVSRGGSWFNGPRFVRSAFRFRSHSGDRNVDLGFRLVTK